MYPCSDIRAIHLEVTARCNASCPMCPRTDQGGPLNKNLPLTELSLQDIKTMFPERFVAQLDRIFMCGNYGDGMVAKDTLEIFRYFRAAKPKISLKMFTNGSGRDPKWWEQLAKVVNTVVFSVDGLEDTNHLYRKDTKWPIIMRSVKAYIGAGGKAEWEFLVFKHNEHQIDEARELARALGFSKFTPKKTERFLKDGKPVDKREVLDRNGNVSYWLERPVGELNQNAALQSIGKLSDAGKTYADYLSETEIGCKAVKDKQIFASAEGLIFPCCWTAKLYDAHRPNGKGEVWRILEKLPGGKDALNAKLHPIEDIVNGPYFQKDVVDSWAPGSKERKDFLVCARACGTLDIMRSNRGQSVDVKAVSKA